MEKLPINPTGKGPADWFTGDVYVDGIYSGQEPSRMTAAHVHFTPGARTHWHRHALGQTLYGTDGVGLVVTRDGTVIVIGPGETVWTPPQEEHWHGACQTNLMSHIALLESTGTAEATTTWLEPVDDEEYARANAAKEQR